MPTGNRKWKRENEQKYSKKNNHLLLFNPIISIFYDQLYVLQGNQQSQKSGPQMLL